MTRRYTETHFNEETREIENVAEWSFSIYPGDNQTFTVCRDGVAKNVKVHDSKEGRVYKLGKSIEADNGAAGLFDFVDKALFEHFMECNAWKVLKYCFENGVKVAQ